MVIFTSKFEDLRQGRINVNNKRFKLKSDLFVRSKSHDETVSSCAWKDELDLGAQLSNQSLWSDFRHSNITEDLIDDLDPGCPVLRFMHLLGEVSLELHMANKSVNPWFRSIDEGRYGMSKCSLRKSITELLDDDSSDPQRVS